MLYYHRPKKENGLKRLTSVMRGFNLGWICAISALTLFVWGIFLWWQQSHFSQHFKFHHVKISMQAKHLDPNALAKVVGENIHGGFFSLDTEKLRAVLGQQPWVKEARFRRLWPDTLLVKVTEQEAEALWNRVGLISKKGEVFFPVVQTLPKNLVKLRGPEGDAILVLKKFKQFQSELALVDAKITALELNKRNSWQMEINGSFKVMLGQKNVDNVFERFLALYPQIISPSKEKALTVDMRYPNGAAIQWETKG